MAKWRVEKSRDAADWEFQWVTISPNRKYLDWSSWGRAMGYVKYEISKERKAMTKTLADMTAVERAECVGMWALIEGINLAVITEADDTDTCVVTYPQWDGDSAVHLNEMVTPRFDLPRAWTPDGEPVPMMKELGFCGTAGLETTVHKYNSGTVYVPEDTPHGEVYRWVGEWEQDNE